MDTEELVQLMGLANPFKQGDLAVGVGTTDDALRAEARRDLARVRLNDIRSTELVADRLSELLGQAFAEDRATRRRFDAIKDKTVGQIRDAMVAADDPRRAAELGGAMTSEMIAAVAKVMTDQQLRKVCGTVFHPLGGAGSVGAQGCFSSRIQPNSPTDDPTEIRYSIFEGLSYGCGDAIIGVNPANDTVDEVAELADLLADVIDRLELPTRWSVLSDIKKQRAAAARGARVDVAFQSLAGTSRALRGMLDGDVDELLALCRSFDGLYFETGQGLEFTNGADEGLDMVTLESRTYGLARLLRRRTGTWTLVNDVAGFIGPEVFQSPEQLLRACLEDLFMGKLHGLTMGLDICSTYHMGIAPDALDAVTTSVARAAPAYLMAVAGKSDLMLGYLTTDFRSHPRLRRALGRSVTAPAAARLRDLGILRPDGALTAQAGDPIPVAAAAGEDPAGAAKTLARLQERGLDLGYGYERDFRAPAHVRRRLDHVFRHAREALYRRVARATLEDASGAYLEVSTTSRSREEYLSRPPTGERIDDAGIRDIQALRAGRSAPQVQIVISDGLNADAVNENLGDLLRPLKARLREANAPPGTDIVVRNGRVRAGYHIGSIVKARLVIHLIGERPGTGSNNLSAYVTYGQTCDGRSLWPHIEHANTTALCSINRHLGVRPAAAAGRIAKLVALMTRHRCSGLALIPHLGRDSAPRRIDPRP